MWCYALERSKIVVQDMGHGGWSLVEGMGRGGLLLVVVARHLWRECWIVVRVLVL